MCCAASSFRAESDAQAQGGARRTDRYRGVKMVFDFLIQGLADWWGVRGANTSVICFLSSDAIVSPCLVEGAASSGTRLSDLRERCVVSCALSSVALSIDGDYCSPLPYQQGV